MLCHVIEIDIRPDRLDEPEVQKLISDALGDLSQRYGGSGDDTPVAAEEFAAPHGAFFVALHGNELVGCAGWRTHGEDAEPRHSSSDWSARTTRHVSWPAWCAHGAGR